MKLKKKVKFALCSVSFATIIAAGIYVDNNILEVNNKVAVLSREIKTKDHAVEELKESNKALQQQLEEVNKELDSVKKEINNVKNWLIKIEMCGHDHSDFKSYMSYKAITDKTSKQYKIIHSDQIVIGNNGLLYDGEYVGVALGSRYGEIGDKYIITFDSGEKFKAIKLDEKSDKHTVENCHHKSDGSLIEFVIDINKAKDHFSTAIKMGDFDHTEQFQGHVIKIEKVVKE